MVDKGELKKLKYLSTIGLLLEQLDAYQLSKKDNGEIIIIAHKTIYKAEFKSNTLYGLVKPLGDWLVSLPKGVWNN